MYPWSQEWGERKRPYAAQLADVLREASECGFTVWEQTIASEAEAHALGALLQQYGVTMPSTYAGGILYDERSSTTIENVVTNARYARALGAQVVVVNLAPLSWSEKLDKDDTQLRHQARALQTLGERLRDEGLILAYHTHDAEMRQSAREFHHMLRATDPDAVGLCLDGHWIYQGAGHSVVALMDIFEMYRGRVRSVHARQSQGNIWTRVFEAEGDVPWRTLADALHADGFRGPVILEQSMEAQTPRDIPFAQAQGRGLINLRELFA